MARWIGALIGLAVVLGGGIALFRPGAAPETATAICRPTAETLSAPSGRDLALCDVLYEVQPSGATWAVIRVLDPGLTQGAGQEDHDWACETWGLAALDQEPRPSRIVVQIMAAPFVRGEPAPDIRQAIEAYAEQDGTCLWELL